MPADRARRRRRARRAPAGGRRQRGRDGARRALRAGRAPGRAHRRLRARRSRTCRSTSTALFGEPTVALRGPWGGGDLVKIGPTATDLSKGLFEYHLDFPGNALDPGCDYLHWERRFTAGRRADGLRARRDRPGVPGKLALQYWFFYVFNDWNNLHEGDWEMIQLVFDASTRGGGARAPAGRGRLQPARGRRARGVGRRQARARRRHASGRAPGGRLARELLRRGALPRQLRRGGRRLRRHARADLRRPPRRPDDPERSAAGAGGRSRGSRSRAAGASCSRRSSTGRPGRT